MLSRSKVYHCDYCLVPSAQLSATTGHQPQARCENNHTAAKIHIKADSLIFCVAKVKFQGGLVTKPT